MEKVAILGAGIAGLSSGWLLKQQNASFMLLEKQPYAGGLARSFTWHGFHCDFAAHRLFTTDEHVLQQMLQLVPMGRHIRRSQIWLRGRWLRDPLDVLELTVNMPLIERVRLLGSYLGRPKKLPDDSFENFVVRRYGRHLYEIFFGPYTERLFGIPGKEISASWAREKVRLANPLDTFRENTKSKFGYFYYPVRGGYGAIANRLCREIEKQVLFEATVLALETNGGRISHVVYENGGTEFREPVEAVVSTLPLTLTGRMLGHDFPMHYQKVEAVYLWMDRARISDHHWFYFMDQDCAINRLVEFKNLSAEGVPKDTTVLCAEVTEECDDVVERVLEDLTKTGLANREEVLDTKVIREEFAYPIYDQHYNKALGDAQEALGAFENLFLVGRAAEFKHREVDDNFAAASETIAELLKGLHIMAPTPIQVEGRQPAPASEPLTYAVILAHDNYLDTEECLQSVMRSAYAHLRVVLVDNGSSDGTADRVKSAFPAVEVLETGQNLSVPAGYNVGFEFALQAGAEYILMLNNDTVIEDTMPEDLVEIAQADPKLGVLMPKVLYYGSETETWSIGGRYRTFPPSILMTEKDKRLAEVPRLIEYAPSCGLLIHRRAFELAGLFDPGYLFWYDDWDFSERVRAHGLTIRYTPEARMWHKVSRTTRGPSSHFFWRTYGASVVRYYRRHGRPVWLSLPIHLGYLILRDFGWKRNWAYWPSFWEGIREGLSRPLGEYPRWVDASSPLDPLTSTKT
ncbi:MAG: glycosyltransferase [Anaerolineales bacterium]